MNEKAQVGAMSTQDHKPAKPDQPVAPGVPKPGEPVSDRDPVNDTKPTDGGQKPTGAPGQTTGNP